MTKCFPSTVLSPEISGCIRMAGINIDQDSRQVLVLTDIADRKGVKENDSTRRWQNKALSEVDKK
jgi:hypothetical protein